MKKIYFLILIFLTINAYCQTAGTAYVNIETPVSICHPGDCIDVTANYATTNTTTSYQVAPVPYIPSFPFFGGVQLFPTDDDKWSQTVNLPFSFCFYGQNYDKLLVGANGVVTFDIQNVVPGGVQIPAGDCPWSFSGPIPNASFPIKNAIYGVYQDTNLLSTAVTNPAMQNVNYYITGTAPNRAYIINFNELPQYQCDGSAGLQTSQIILYETTNIVDVLVRNRTACSAWQSGAGVIGIQNQAGTLATVPSGRNTGNWSATNEAWRFTPNGNSNTTFFWSLNGVYLGNNNPVNVCPNDGDILQAVVTYTACDGVQTQIMDNLTLNIVPEPAIMSPLNIETCVADNTVPAAFNLDQDAYILNGLSPLEYSVDYFTSSSLIPHTNLNAFMSTGQTIYAYITHMIDTDCLTIKTFDLILNTIPGAPTGNSTQAYTEGQTLADLQVESDNIIWYTDEFGQTVLPSTTVLVDGVTYYAAQSNASGCVSGKSAGRLAVTVYNVLNTDSFDANAFKVYPNPVKDILSLSYSKEISNVSVFNLVGQEVLTKIINATQSQINLSGLSGGTYMVKVTVNGLVKTIKVVKE